MERDQIITNIGRYSLNNILNLDETPIPFEYLGGRNFDFIGNGTISAKTQQSGWDKRQATLILYLFAGGVSRIKPKLIFHGSSGPNAKIRSQEGNQYHSGVLSSTRLHTARSCFLQFIDEELIPVLNPSRSESLDAAAFHTTDEVLARLRDAKIMPSLIPGGCPGLVQPLDTAVKKPFKAYG